MNEPAMPLHDANNRGWLTYLILMSGAVLRRLDSCSAAPGDGGCSACRLDKALSEAQEPLRRRREGRSCRR